MTTSIEKPQEALFAAPNLAYIRRIASEEVAELPEDALKSIADPQSLFVLANGEGQRLAIIEGRDEAFEAARQHAFAPMSVH